MAENLIKLGGYVVQGHGAPYESPEGTIIVDNENKTMESSNFAIVPAHEIIDEAYDYRDNRISFPYSGSPEFVVFPIGTAFRFSGTISEPRYTLIGFVKNRDGSDYVYPFQDPEMSQWSIEDTQYVSVDGDTYTFNEDLLKRAIDLGANWVKLFVDYENVNLISSQASVEAEKVELQQKLTSNVNIKTVNGESILGPGNLAISANPTFVCERYSEDKSVGGGGLQNITLSNRSKAGYTPLMIALNGALATDGSSIGVYYNLTSRTLASGLVSDVKVQIRIGTTSSKTIRFVTDVLWMKN